jgi:hypothetical protein
MNTYLTYKNLSPSDCFDAAYTFFENADASYYKSEEEAEKGSFAAASALLVHSLEETARGMILFLDSKGFTFRKEVEHLDELFNGQSLRAGMILLLSVHYVVAKDLTVVSEKILSNPDKLNQWTAKKGLWTGYVISYLTNYAGAAFKELFWYSGAGFLRKETIAKASKKEYQSLLLRMDAMRTFVGNTTDIFNHESHVIADKTQGLTEAMYHKDLYTFCNKLLSKIKDQKASPISIVALLIELFAKKF